MRIKDTYKREVEGKPINNLVFSGAVSLLIILATVFIGIKPIYQAIKLNTEYKEELNKINSNMETKLEQIKTSEKDLQQVEKKMELLNKKIPETVNFQKFLEQLVVVSARSNFILQKANQQSSSESSKEYIVSAKFIGRVETLPDLLNTLENKLPRFIIVDRIRTQNQPKENYDLIEIIMKAYTL